MCKKFYLVLAALMVTFGAFAQEEQAQEVQVPTDSLGIHPWNDYENENHIVIPDASHWSIYIAGGFNIFDGDYTSEKKHAVWAPTLSLGGAYHWNNTWALAAEYKFRDYRVTGNGGAHAEVLLRGMSHQANAYVTFDIFNAFRPQNKRKIFALDLILGGGAIFKKNSIFYRNIKDSLNYFSYGPASNDFIYERRTATQPVESDSKYKVYGVFIGGVSAEFNINRSLQLGLRGTYNYTTTDQIEGRPRGNNNDGFFDCELLLRYKFQPRKKSNVRNFMKDQDIRDWNDGTQFVDSAMGKAKRDKYKKPVVDMIITRDTIYSITRDTVYIMGGGYAPAAAPALKECKETYVVYFENDVPELDKAAMAITGKAAAHLNMYSGCNAVVIGSCDNTGAVTYNQWLAVQRANNVTKMLESLGVEGDRIYTVGRGIMQDDRAEGSYSANRRVEIRIVSDEDWAQAKEDYAYFEQYKNVKKSSAVRKAGEGKYASSSEVLKAAIQSMKETGEAAPIEDVINALIGDQEAQEAAAESVETKENVSEKADVTSENVQEAPAKTTEEVVEEVAEARVVDPSEVLDVVVVTPNMTLSKLARKYYDGNTSMWVKIFEANRDVIASPDHLEDGMKLIIPKL